VEVSLPADLAARLLRPNERVELVDVGSPAYGDVLDVASRAYAKSYADVAHAVDPYSEIYALRDEHRLLGTVSITRAWEGPLPCEEFFPTALLDAFRNATVTAYRLCVLPEDADGGRIAKGLTLAAWVDQIPRGCRMTLFNANERLVKYYVRQGYLPLKGGKFTHPRYGTRSHAMILPTDPEHPSLAAPLFQSVTAPVTVKELLRRDLIEHATKPQRLQTSGMLHQ
jgi:hypothetical protein